MACLVKLIASLRKALFKQINVNTMTVHDEGCSAWNCSFVDWDSLCDSHRITPDRDNNLTLGNIVPCWPHPNNRDTSGNIAGSSLHKQTGAKVAKLLRTAGSISISPRLKGEHHAGAEGRGIALRNGSSGTIWPV